MTRYLYACDPGGVTTGIVLLAVPENQPVYLEESWSLDGSIESFLHWWENVSDPDPGTVFVCEQFVQRNIAGVDLSPLKLEGAIETLCRQNGVSLVLQPASGKDSAVPDSTLERLHFVKKLWVEDNHSDRWQALKHGVRYLKRTRHLPTIRKGWPDV